VVRGASARGEVSAEGHLASGPGAKSFHNSFRCHIQPAWRADLSSHKLAIDNLKIALVVVAPSATGDRADLYECLAEWDHLQVRMSVAGRRWHGGAFPTEDSIGDWLAGSSGFGMSRMAVVFDFNRDKALDQIAGRP
jgi:hypothetical protein